MASAIADFLGTSPALFYDELLITPTGTSKATAADTEYADVQRLMTTPDGVVLIRSFVLIQKTKLRRRLIALIEELGGRPAA